MLVSCSWSPWHCRQTFKCNANGGGKKRKQFEVCSGGGMGSCIQGKQIFGNGSSWQISARLQTFVNLHR